MKPPFTMSRFRGPGKWYGPSQSNTGSSIRGKTISHPIPISDDDEFPIRTPGTGIATPLLTDPGFEHHMRTRSSTTGILDNPAYQTGVAISDFTDPSAVTYTATITAQPMSDGKLRRTKQPSTARNSTASIPSGSSIGKPQQKKSSLRSVLGRIFGSRKGKGNTSSTTSRTSNSIRAEQHRSVSLYNP